MVIMVIKEMIFNINTKIIWYAKKSIYNIDEICLFYWVAPNKTIICLQIEESKKDKIKIIISLTTNANKLNKLKTFILRLTIKSCAFNLKTSI